MKRLIHFLIFLFLADIGLAFGSELQIENLTSQGIINIFVKPGDKKPFFIRLDLLPGGSDIIANPAVSGSLRVDTGHQFWFFPDINLAPLKTVIFCPTHPVCLQQITQEGKTMHVEGTVQELAPQKGAKPVCNLDSFKSGMTMKEVCYILPGHMVTDDNGAILTGLGFANMVWAARLVPAKQEKITGNSTLEHLELRLPLSHQNIDSLFKYLFKSGFVPWQAEFPGQELEFATQASGEKAVRSNSLLNKTYDFLKASASVTHKKHSKGDSCEQATIMFAPEGIIPALNNADEPHSDVQIYTVYMRPCTDTLLLDVTAYAGQK